MNTIVPIRAIQPIESLDSLKAVSSPLGAGMVDSPAIPFKSLFQDAVNNAKETHANLDNEIYKMTTGQSDNLHDAMLASQKASLSIDMVVELRNKLLDAHKEIMNMNV